MKKLSIIIVNWNSGEFLSNCISSIYEYIGVDNKYFDLIVVDNNSQDDSLRSIPTQINLKIIQAGENVGFAKACNIGASNSNSEYLLFLNPDTEIHDQSIFSAITLIENKNLSVIGIEHKNFVGETTRGCANHPSCFTLINHSLGLYKIHPKLFPSFKLHTWDHKTSRFVDHIIGSFYLLKRETFLSVGGFDERFFLYYEDLDLSLRIGHTGLKIFYCSSLSILHKGGGTSEKIQYTRIFYSSRSRIQYALKNFNSFDSTLVIISLTLFEPIIRLIICILTFDFRCLIGTIKAYGKLYGSIIFLCKK